MAKKFKRDFRDCLRAKALVSLRIIKTNVNEIFMREKLLSIIATSYSSNRLNDVFELLDSINSQTYLNIEVIFVVDRSKTLYDRVKAYTEERKICNVKVLFNNSKVGLSVARNLGIKEARGDIVAFVDDDVVLFPNWALEVVRTYQDHSIVGVTGPAIPLWETRRPDWFPREFEWLVGGTAWYEHATSADVRNAWGMNMSFRRKPLVDSEGFQSNFGLRNVGRSGWTDPPSEDVDLSFRVKSRTGGRIVYNPMARVNHKVSTDKLNLAFLLKRALSVGYQRRMIKKLYEKSQKDHVLALEHKLLKSQILAKFFPSLLTEFPKRPKTALHKALIALVIVMLVGVGYCLTI